MRRSQREYQSGRNPSRDLSELCVQAILLETLGDLPSDIDSDKTGDAADDKRREETESLSRVPAKVAKNRCAGKSEELGQPGKTSVSRIERNAGKGRVHSLTLVATVRNLGLSSYERERVDI